MKQLDYEFPEMSTKSPRYYYDTRVGIKKMLKRNGRELGLQKVVQMRQQYIMDNPNSNVKFIELILFGDKLLERHGELYQIQDLPEEMKKLCKEIMTLEEFWDATGVKSYTAKKIM